MTVVPTHTSAAAATKTVEPERRGGRLRMGVVRSGVCFCFGGARMVVCGGEKTKYRTEARVPRGRYPLGDDERWTGCLRYGGRAPGAERGGRG
jgi:hypothetical protein